MLAVSASRIGWRYWGRGTALRCGGVLTLVMAALCTQTAAQADSSTGRLSYTGQQPVSILYIIERTDSAVSLTLEVSDQRFDATHVVLTAEQLAFDWVPGDAPVHCELVRAHNTYEGDCSDDTGRSLHLTMEVLPLVDKPPDTIPQYKPRLFRSLE